MYIYKTTNKLNGRIYIGKSAKEFNPNYYGSGKILNRAIKKYGKENFFVEVIEYCNSIDELNEREIYWISTFMNGYSVYNVAKGGTGGWTTMMYDEKQKSAYRKKLSDSRLGRVVSKETRDKLSLANKGRLFGDREKQIQTLKNMWLDPNSTYNGQAYRDRLSKSLIGKVCSDETKNKIRQTKIGSKNPASKKIMVGEKTYDTIKDCALEYGLSGTAIAKRCRSSNFKEWKFL